MDKVELTRAGRPLQIRSGHTPVNIGLLIGSLLASLSAFAVSTSRSAVVRQVLPPWAMTTFYVVLLVSSAVALSAVWRPMPHELTEETYRVITGRLVRERVGHYGVAGIMACFSISAMANSLSGLTAASMLMGVAGGLVMRARQTKADLDKLQTAMRTGDTVEGRLLADPGDQT